MPYRLSQKLAKYLLNQPEFGMGYQVVAIDKRPFVVINTMIAFESRFFLMPDTSGNGKLDASSFLRVWSTHFDMYWELDDDQWLVDLQELSGEEDVAAALGAFEELDGQEVEVATHGSYLSETKSGEIFVRYTAFANDRRINSDGSVTAGTYVTTENDSLQVPSGLAAVGRYALPNQRPAIFRFTLCPPSGVSIKCGTCSPKFGRSGGGVEAFFSDALPSGTALGPIRLAER